MDPSRHESGHDNMGTLVEDARALLTATANVAGDQIDEARQRVAAALGNGRAAVNRVREKAVEGAEAAGDVVRHHPFQAMAIGFGLGAIVGILIARRRS